MSYFLLEIDVFLSSTSPLIFTSKSGSLCIMTSKRIKGIENHCSVAKELITFESSSRCVATLFIISVTSQCDKLWFPASD